MSYIVSAADCPELVTWFILEHAKHVAEYRDNPASISSKNSYDIVVAETDEILSIQVSDFFFDVEFKSQDHFLTFCLKNLAS